jgi:glycerol-3-phosphate dehydrogenase
VADFDLAIIGGGINGVGIARDAAGRGLKVVLVEQNDLGSGTSSASSKLIHGGLRYLEHGAFRLVRAALAEREVLLRMAPHLVRPLRFVLPLSPDGRHSPAMLRLGLFIYDWIGGRRILPGTRSLDLIEHEAGLPLKRRFHHGYEYSDCFVDDARLVVLNAVDAAERGAVIRTRTRCVRVEREEVWRLILNVRGQRDVISARVLVNAAGPWVGFVGETVLRQPPPPVRLDKGTHIVVPRLYEHARAYILQAADGRVVFTIPFERDFTLIGTTDQPFVGDPAAVVPSAEEINYLCTVVNDYFRTVIGAADVVWAFAGVRALHDDGSRKAQDVGRDYALTLDERFRAAPVLAVVGGKLTTYRRLAEAALARLAHFFPRSRPWTARAPLPGGDFVYDGVETLIERTQRTWPFLSAEHTRRLVHAYGTRVDRVLADAKKPGDLGMTFGADLTAAEVRYLKDREWAQTADDVLWRRSKLGLRLNAVQQAALEHFMRDLK